MAGDGPTGFEFQRLHGMGEALYDAVTARRRAFPAASTHRSAAIATCSPISSAGSSRTAPIHPSSRWSATAPCRSRACSRARPALLDERRSRPPRAHSAAGRPLRAGAAELARHGVRRSRGRPARRWSMASGEAGEAIARAADARRPKVAGTPRQVSSPVDGKPIVGEVVETPVGLDRCDHDRGRRRLRGMVANAGRGARGRARAARRPPRSRARRAASRCLRAKAARRWTTASPRCARRSTSAATTPPRRAACSPRTRSMPGPTGERDVLRRRGRGVFVCISPWNFPLAIFLGQVTAALAAGNAVVAKPAEQTPLIAYRAFELLHRAGVPRGARPARARRRQGRRGAGRASARSPASPSPARPRSRWAINRALAAKHGPIVPLIAETGGINAMIVDATALPEQVDRRRHLLGLPLGRPALLGAPPPLPAGGRRRRHARDDRGRRGGADARRSRAIPPPMSARSSTREAKARSKRISPAMRSVGEGPLRRQVPGGSLAGGTFVAPAHRRARRARRD